jgi:hypothetical protein
VAKLRRQGPGMAFLPAVLALVAGSLGAAEPPQGIPAEVSLSVHEVRGAPSGIVRLMLPEGGRVYCHPKSCLGPTTGTWLTVEFTEEGREDEAGLQLSRLTVVKWPFEDEIRDLPSGGSVDTLFRVGDGRWSLVDASGTETKRLDPGRYSVRACIRVHPWKGKRFRTLRISEIQACSEPVPLEVGTTKPELGRSPEEDRLMLTVVNGSDRSRTVAGAVVLVYSEEMKLQELGRTDDFGEVELSKARISQSPVPVLLVCKPPGNFFGCAGVSLEMTHLLEFEEYVITLPPVSLY